MNKIYKIYLDVCCLNRPFDDLEQSRIRIEAEAITEIIQNCENGKWIFINSDGIEFEGSQHPDSSKQEQVQSILRVANLYIQSNQEIELRAEELMRLNFKFQDALHLAFAEAGEADILLTTDDRLLRKAKTYQNTLKIAVENPTIWLMNTFQTEEETHEINGN